MRRIAVLITPVAIALLLVACGADRGTRRDLTLGVHHVSIRLPEGWQVLDFGREVRVSGDGLAFTLGDLGPLGPEGLESPDAPALAAAALERLEPAARRDVAARRLRPVAGRPTVVFDTWDRLTHEHRRRVAFVLHDGHALVLNTKEGGFAAAGPRFEAMLDSLRFETPAGAIAGS